MNLKEQLRNLIEEERKKLNSMVAGGGKVEDAYRQSLVVDRLLEQSLEAECKKQNKQKMLSQGKCGSDFF